MLGANASDSSPVGLPLLLPLDCRPNVIVTLHPDETLQAVPPGKTIYHRFSMFACAARDVAGHAYVKGAIRPVSYDVNPST